MAENYLEYAEHERDRGNVLFKAKQFVDSIRCYYNALQRIDEHTALSSILCNCATTTIKINSSPASKAMTVAFAAAALSVSPRYEKARLRLFGELSRLHGKKSDGIGLVSSTKKTAVDLCV